MSKFKINDIRRRITLQSMVLFLWLANRHVTSFSQLLLFIDALRPTIFYLQLIGNYNRQMNRRQLKCKLELIIIVIEWIEWIERCVVKPLPRLTRCEKTATLDRLIGMIFIFEQSHWERTGTNKHSNYLIVHRSLWNFREYLERERESDLQRISCQYVQHRLN